MPRTKAQQSDNEIRGLCRCGREKIDPSLKKCMPCGQSQRDYYYRNKEKVQAYQKQHKSSLKTAAFEAYGGFVCACCGEVRKEFLTLDHVANDGGSQRRELGIKGAGPEFYRWLRDNGYPAGLLKVACMNCNFSRGLYGYCPHERERESRCGTVVPGPVLAPSAVSVDHAQPEGA